MKQKGFIVETYVDGDSKTFIVREQVENNHWEAKVITSDPAELANFFGAL